MSHFNRLHDFEALPGSALVSVTEIKLLAGRSAASIWRDVRRGRLPRPIPLGPNASRWRVADVRVYLNGGQYHV